MGLVGQEAAARLVLSLGPVLVLGLRPAKKMVKIRPKLGLLGPTKRNKEKCKYDTHDKYEMINKRTNIYKPTLTRTSIKETRP